MSKSPITVKILTQWIVGGSRLQCRICKDDLKPEDKIHWDHIHAEVFDGPHEWSNLRPTHAACNRAKGVKEHKANAKVDRILGLTCNGPKKQIPSRPFSKPRAANFPLSTTQKDE